MTEGGSAFALFDTVLGRCGVVWGSAGVSGFQLPEEDACATGARLRRRFPHARAARPDAGVAQVISAVSALLETGRGDLADVPLDLSAVPAFDRGVLLATRAIPPGRTLTYGEVARTLGEDGAAQAVGRALGRNPVPVIVPCHRVVGGDGRLVGFSAHGGTALKRRLLALEGASVAAQGVLFG